MGTWYQLDGNNQVVACDDLPKEGVWRRVAEDDLPDYRVSTVFLGLDHNFENSGPPLVFETMVFPSGEWSEVYCERYSTWDQAEVGHKKAVKEYETELQLTKLKHKVVALQAENARLREQLGDIKEIGYPAAIKSLRRENARLAEELLEAEERDTLKSLPEGVAENDKLREELEICRTAGMAVALAVARKYERLRDFVYRRCLYNCTYAPIESLRAMKVLIDAIEAEEK